MFKFVTAALIAGAALAAPANAQDARIYPWCAEYGGGNGGRNCGFQTFAQCRAAISGDNQAVCINTGGYAERPAYGNYQYDGPRRYRN